MKESFTQEQEITIVSTLLYAASEATGLKNTLDPYLKKDESGNAVKTYYNKVGVEVEKPTLLYAYTFEPPRGPAGLEGPKGDPGQQGIQGPRGLIGESGEQGPKGDKGDQGATGSPGPIGSQGPKGDQGATGPPGLKGDQGDKGDQGPKGDTGDKGANVFDVSTIMLNGDSFNKKQKGEDNPPEPVSAYSSLFS